MLVGSRCFCRAGAVLQFVGARLAEDLVHWFEVHGGQGADVEAHLLERGRVELLGFGGYGGFVAHDYVFGLGRVVVG